MSWLDKWVWVVKEGGCYLVTFPHQTFIFDWCMVHWWSKNKHHKNTYLKEIRLHLQILLTTPHSIVYITRRTYIFNQGINKCALPMTITKSEKVKFLNPIFANACTIDLLIQHKFCCVILIDRSWRTWKMTQITPTYLTHCYHSSWWQDLTWCPSFEHFFGAPWAQ
jgi:hypothetical protein